MKIRLLFFTATFLARVISASESLGELVEVSSEFAAACSVLSSDDTREFATSLLYAKKDVKNLGRLIGCTSFDGFTLEMNNLTQHRHARAVIAAIELGLKPRINQQSEVIVDRLPLLRTTLWNRLIDDKEMDEKVGAVIVSDQKLKAECLKELVSRMPWRAVSMLQETESLRERSQRRFAMGMCLIDRHSAESEEVPGVFGGWETSSMKEVSYGLFDRPTVCSVHALHEPTYKSNAWPLQCLADCNLATSMGQLVASPCGRFVAYIKNTGDEETFCSHVEVLNQKGHVVHNFSLGATGSGSLHYARNGSLIVTYNCHYDEWDIESKQKVREFLMPEPLGVIAFSHDGGKVAINQNGEIFIKNRDTCETVEVIRGPFKKVDDLQFTKDGALRVIGSKKSDGAGERFIWNIGEGKPLYRLGFIDQLYGGGCLFDSNAEKVLFKSQSNELSLFCKKQLRLLDIATGRLLAVSAGESKIYKGSFNGDGSCMVTLHEGSVKGIASVSNVSLIPGKGHESQQQRDSTRWYEVMMWLNGAEQLKKAGHTVGALPVDQLILFARTGSHY